MTTPTQHPASTTLTDRERRALDAASCGNCGERTAVLNLVGRIVAAHVTDALDERYAESDHKAAKYWRAKWEAEVRAEKAERDFRDLQSESRVLPCDGGCAEAPEEDCSRHGRTPAELWAMLAEVMAQRDAAREALARVEAVVGIRLQCTQHGAALARRCSECERVGVVNEYDRTLRAALAQPATPARATITIPTPTISTGPNGMTETEAAERYLRGTISRVPNLGHGSGVTGLIVRLLSDVIDALAVVNAQPATDEGAGA